MAQLFRYLFTDDRQKSEIFTFMIPSSFLLDVENDLKSRDFTSSNQKWSLSFSKANDQLSVYLTLKSAYEGMLVIADYGNLIALFSPSNKFSIHAQFVTLKA